MNIEALQEKLEGVFDMHSAEGCRSVIASLLSNIEILETAKQDAERRLKVLALLVTGDKPNAKEVAWKTVEKIKKKSPSGLMDFLFRMCDEADKAEKLGDEGLLSESVRVWAEFDMHSRESAVLDELIQRYKKAKGIGNAVNKVPEVQKQ